MSRELNHLRFSGEKSLASAGAVESVNSDLDDSDGEESSWSGSNKSVKGGLASQNGSKDFDATSMHTHFSFAEHQRERGNSNASDSEREDSVRCGTEKGSSQPTTEPSAAPDSSASPVPADQERQILLLMLLAQVAALHDPTPRTFTVHVLELFERGILDRQSIRFLYDLGLVPSAANQSLLLEDEQTHDANEGVMVPVNHVGHPLRARSLEASAIRKTLEHHEQQHHLLTHKFHSDSEALPSKPPSWNVDEHPLSLSRYKREFIEIGMLASGSFGKVFSARNSMDGRNYAVKRVPFSANGYSKDSVQQVVREVHCLAVCDHPNVVRYYTSWLEPSWMTGESSMITGGDDNINESAGSINRITDNLQQMIASGQGSETLSDDLKAYFKDPSVGRPKRRSSLGGASFDFDDASVSSWGDHADVSEWTVDQSKDDMFVDGPASQHRQCMNPYKPHNNGKKPEKMERPGPSYRYQICLFIQMQLCHPATLADWIRTRNQKTAHRSLSDRIETSAEIFGQIVSGLLHVHGKHIIHRDLKPANVFASADGLHFKIGDFGLSKLISAVTDETSERAKSPKAGHRGRFQRHQQLLLLDAVQNPSPRNFKDVDTSWKDPLTAGVGTASYAAPEQVATRDYGASADIFSLGLILLELLCCFSTEHERLQTFHDCRHRRSLPPEFDEYPILVKTILACTEPEPMNRPSATDLHSLQLLNKYAVPQRGEAPVINETNEIEELKRRLAETELQLEASKMEIKEKDRQVIELQRQVKSLQEGRTLCEPLRLAVQESDIEFVEPAPSSSICSSTDSEEGI